MRLLNTQFQDRREIGLGFCFKQDVVSDSLCVQVGLRLDVSLILLPRADDGELSSWQQHLFLSLNIFQGSLLYRTYMVNIVRDWKWHKMEVIVLDKVEYLHYKSSKALSLLPLGKSATLSRCGFPSVCYEIFMKYFHILQLSLPMIAHSLTL